jgi:hypothetical protein
MVSYIRVCRYYILLEGRAIADPERVRMIAAAVLTDQQLQVSSGGRTWMQP